MNMGFDVAEELFRGVKKYGGYTLWLSSQYREHGYLVEPRLSASVFVNIYFPEIQIIQTFRDFIHDYGDRGDCIGVFVDEDLLCCVVYDWVLNMQEAINLAMNRHHSSIYDLENAESIYLDDSQIAA